MPQIFKIGSYWVFFWANESDPLDPVHVYVCEGAPNANATKIWVTRAGKCRASVISITTIPASRNALCRIS